jgi:carbonic anhydrase
MQHCWLTFLISSFALAQITVDMNGLIDAEPTLKPFNFTQEGRDWPGYMCATSRYQTPIDIADSYSNLQVVTADNSTFREFNTSTPPFPRSDVSIQDAEGLLVYWFARTEISQEILGQTIQRTLMEVQYMVPAEHTFNGLRYPLELHMTYVMNHPSGNIYGGISFFLLYQEGREDPFLEDLINENHTTIDISPVFPSNGIVDDYYFYTGTVNLPWPDCWPLSWVMPNYILEASPRQIQYFNDLYIQNLTFSDGRGIIRALQPLNDILVYHYITPSEPSFLS